MITLGTMQFTAVVLMVLLTVKLLALRRRRIESGTASRADRWVGPATWTVVMVMLVVAALADGQPLLSDTPQRRLAEKGGAVLYMLMQGYYTWSHTKNLMVMRRALHNYYDRDTDGMLRWMQLSVVGLMLLALMVPVAIFGTGAWLLVIAFAVYFFIFYLIDSFCYYLVSPAPARIQAAEQNADEVEQEQQTEHPETTAEEAPLLTTEAMPEVEQAVETWKVRGGYRQSGLLQPQAAQDIGVSRYRLTIWLHQQNLKYTEWIAGLRIEEAKRLMKEHPELGNDAIAEHCGFGDRTVLQRTFKKLTGMTPQQYVSANAKHNGA